MTDMMTETISLTEHEFRALLPCEKKDHSKRMDKLDEPIEWLHHTKCPGCGAELVVAMCDPCKRDMLAGGGWWCSQTGGCGKLYKKNLWISIWQHVPEGR